MGKPRLLRTPRTKTAHRGPRGNWSGTRVAARLLALSFPGFRAGAWLSCVGTGVRLRPTALREWLGLPQWPRCKCRPGRAVTELSKSAPRQQAPHLQKRSPMDAQAVAWRFTKGVRPRSRGCRDADRRGRRGQPDPLSAGVAGRRVARRRPGSFAGRPEARPARTQLAGWAGDQPRRVTRHRRLLDRTPGMERVAIHLPHGMGQPVPSGSGAPALGV
jgi:hypothetical protein